MSNVQFSRADLADCAEREVKQRRRVYPNLVTGGKMTREFADRQIAMMEEIARDYRRVAAVEAARGDLFKGEA
jgi:hypothetical protein